jgi:hypothetical protein
VREFLTLLSARQPDIGGMSQFTTRSVETDSITRVGWLAVALVAITGVLHVYAGAVEGQIPVALAGIGFFAAVGLYLLDYRRRLLYLVGIGYTAVQIPLWYVANAGEFSLVGYVDKTVQVVLVAVLVYLYWQTRPGSEDQHASSPTEQAS